MATSPPRFGRKPASPGGCRRPALRRRRSGSRPGWLNMLDRHDRDRRHGLGPARAARRSLQGSIGRSWAEIIAALDRASIERRGSISSARTAGTVGSLDRMRHDAGIPSTRPVVPALSWGDVLSDRSTPIPREGEGDAVGCGLQRRSSGSRLFSAVPLRTAIRSESLGTGGDERPATANCRGEPGCRPGILVKEVSCGGLRCSSPTATVYLHDLQSMATSAVSPAAMPVRR